MRSALAILAAFAFALAACSNSNPSNSSEDASLGPGQPLGSPCNASLTNACAAAPSACSVNSCVSGVCEQFILDAGGACSVVDAAPLPPINALCTTNSDCDGGLCGYLATGGCSVTGVCFPASSSNGTLPPAACGCNGLPDPYVTPDFTGAPAASPGACVDGGGDASVDASLDAGVDASLDAGTDAADSGDASDGAPE